MSTSTDLWGCMHLSDLNPLQGGFQAPLVTLDNLKPIAGSLAVTSHSNVCPMNLQWSCLCLPWWPCVMGNQGSILEREPEKWLPHPRKASGRQIIQSWLGEVVWKNYNNKGLLQGPVIRINTAPRSKATNGYSKPWPLGRWGLWQQGWCMVSRSATLGGWCHNIVAEHVVVRSE